MPLIRIWKVSLYKIWTLNMSKSEIFLIFDVIGTLRKGLEFPLGIKTIKASKNQQMRTNIYLRMFLLELKHLNMPAACFACSESTLSCASLSVIGNLVHCLLLRMKMIDLVSLSELLHQSDHLTQSCAEIDFKKWTAKFICFANFIFAIPNSIWCTKKHIIACKKLVAHLVHQIGFGYIKEAVRLVHFCNSLLLPCVKLSSKNSKHSLKLHRGS